MTKNHDMRIARANQTDKMHDATVNHGGVPKDPSVPYLILVRNYLEAVVSDFNLYLRSHEDGSEIWQTFAKRKTEYYRRFVTKWVLENEGLDALVVKYEDLTAQPESMFHQMIEFFQPKEQVDLEWLKQVINESNLSDTTPTGTKVLRNFGVRNRRKIEDFHHYDRGFFGELEEELSDTLTSLGYELRFQELRRAS